MADPNEKTIGGDGTGVGNTEKIISGSQPGTGAAESIIPGKTNAENTEDISAPLPPTSTSNLNADFNLKERLQNATLQGGLTDIPDDFNLAGGSWKTINATDDPFKVLYFDYSKYENITDAMVVSNHQKLYGFWNEKRLLTGNNKMKVEAKYTKETIASAEKKLEAARKKLSTQNGRELYFKELDSKRVAAGLQAIAQFIKFVLEDGDCTRERGIQIIELGKENNLYENEIRNYLLHTLNAKGFGPKPGLNSPDFLNNEWMTATARALKDGRRIPDIFVLGKKAISLKEIGEILYNNAGTAKTEYLHNASYIIGDITKLENSGKARAYEKLLNTEPDIEKRFLKIVYRLNPTLPYKISAQSFTNIGELLQKTALDHRLFIAACNDYNKGYIHIWLRETDTANAAKLPSGFDYNNFLNFIFKINSNHGIYLGQEKFGTPEQLVAKAKTDKAYWPKITEAMQAGVLPAWFAGIGRQNWLGFYDASVQQLISDNLFVEEEKKLATVQTLIRIIDKSVANPEIKAMPVAINLPALDGSKIINEKIHLSLTNFGFVKAKIRLKQTIAGIQLSGNNAVFFSLDGNTAAELFLQINPLKLQKDKLYTMDIEIQSAFQIVTIPVEIKVAIPQKNQSVDTAKHTGFGALLFGITRPIIGAIAKTGERLTNINRAHPSSDKGFFTENHFYYLLMLVILLAIVAGSLFLIKRMVDNGQILW